MIEEIIYQEDYDDKTATDVVQRYLNRHLGITVAVIPITVESIADMTVYINQYPVRFAIVTDSAGVEQDATYFNRRIYAPHFSPWKLGDARITYASGFGLLKGTLPTGLHPDFTSNLTNARLNRLLPRDIASAIGSMENILADRAHNRADVQSYSGSLANTQYLSPVYRATIPTEVRGLLMNHRRVVVG